MTPVDLKIAQIKSFKSEINKTLKYQDTVLFQGIAELEEIRGKNNQDGSQNLTYVCKPTLVDIRASQLDTEVPVSIIEDNKLKEKSLSQALRQFAYRVSLETGESQEALYREAIQRGTDYLQEKLDNL